MSEQGQINLCDKKTNPPSKVGSNPIAVIVLLNRNAEWELTELSLWYYFSSIR